MSAVDQNRGVGQCPERPEGMGHVWAGAMASGDASNPCRFCGASGRVFFQAWCAARMASFVGVRVPMQSGTGDPRKAWPDGMPEEMAERARLIREDKSRRDREARS